MWIHFFAHCHVAPSRVHHVRAICFWPRCYSTYQRLQTIIDCALVHSYQCSANYFIVLSAFFLRFGFPRFISFDSIASAPLSSNKISYQELWKTACFPFRLQSLSTWRDIEKESESECATSTRLFFNRVSFQSIVVHWWRIAYKEWREFMCCIVFNEAMK